MNLDIHDRDNRDNSGIYTILFEIVFSDELKSVMVHDNEDCC